MKKYILELEAIEPLVITDGTAEGMAHRCLDYVPGNMILGAFAWKWKNAHPNVNPDEDPEFRKLFLDGGVLWGHAVPVVGNSRCVPVPLSFQYAKNHAGLPVEGDNTTDDCMTVNRLWSDSQNIQAEQQIKKEFELEEHEAIKWKKFSGGFMSPGECCLSAQQQIWTMHVAIAEDRTAAESQLFGYSAIAAGSKLQSEICCDDTLAGTLTDLCSGKQRFRFGHARSAGYGSCAAKLFPVSVADAKTPQKESFTLFLESSYCPSCSWDNPLTTLEKDLAVAYGDPDLKIEQSFSSVEIVNGFNGLWRLPRRSRRMVSAGSVLQVRAPGAVGRKLPPALGGCTAEGYGRFMCEPEFLGSLIIKPKTVQAAKGKLEPRPVSTVGDSSLLKAVIKRSLKRQAYERALEFVSREEIISLVEEVAAKNGPGPAQRGNLRMLVTCTKPDTWLGKFEDLLTKSAADQWTKKVVSGKLLEKGHDKEYLSDVIKNLLSQDQFRDSFIRNPPALHTLPGMTEQDQKFFENNFQRLALLEFIRLWDKKARL